MSKTETEIRFTPSVAKHYAARAASLTRKITSLSEDVVAAGCSSGKFSKLMERLEAAAGELEQTVLDSSEGGRVSAEEKAEIERAERAAAKKKKARAAARKAKAAESTEKAA